MAVIAMLRIGRRTNQGLTRGVMLTDRRGSLVPSQKIFFSRYPMPREDGPPSWRVVTVGSGGGGGPYQKNKDGIEKEIVMITFVVCVTLVVALVVMAILKSAGALR